jgi:Flp pilus assembly protein TadG
MTELNQYKEGLMATSTLRPTKGTRQLKSESGSILILTALAMVAMLGVVALAVDASYMYTERNRMSAAADAAAKTAAWEVYLGNTTQGNLEGHADYEVGQHNLSPARLGGDTVVEVNRPPLSGSHTTESTYVEVYVSRPTDTFFGRILGWASLTPKARAVAGQSNSAYCLITMGESPAGISLGNTTLTMPNCAIADAGDLVSTNPGGRGTILSNGTAIGDDACQGNCANMGTVTYNAPNPVDPLAGSLAPVDTGTCVADPGTVNIPAGCYTGLTVTVNRTISPGTLYVTGPITFNSGRSLSGTSGTTLVIANGGSLIANQNNLVTLVAPTRASGATYPGIALYQVASNTSPITFENSSMLNLTGAMYAPTSDVSFRNGLDTSSDCVLFVVKSITVDNGNGTLNNACSTYAGSPLMTVSLAE